MRKIGISVILMLVEAFVFLCLTTLLNIPDNKRIFLLIILVLFLFIFNHYKITSKLIWDEMRSLAKAMLCFFVNSAIILLAVEDPYWYIKSFLLSFIMYLVALLTNRYCRIFFRNIFKIKTLIIGTDYEASRFGDIAKSNRFMLTEIDGYVRYRKEAIHEELEAKSAKIFEDKDLENILARDHIEQVIVVLPDISKDEINQLMLRLHDRVRIIKYMPTVNVTLTFNSVIQDFDGSLLVSTAQGRIDIFERFLKRIVDIIASIFGLILLLPLSVFVKVKNCKNNDHDPIFFKQDRIGLDGKPIKIYKFRSMIPNAEAVLEELMEKDPAIREEYLKNKKLKNDPRITEAGKILRKTSLDEFPQFINVLKGEMSLVGPRPYLFREKKDMGIYYNSIIKCKPGITGMWQANGRSDVGFEERCKLDDYYYKNWTFGLDLIIIYKTIKSVIYGKGAL